MKKFVVSEDTEVVLNGKKFLLESGDEIGFEDDEDDDIKATNLGYKFIYGTKEWDKVREEGFELSDEMIDDLALRAMKFLASEHRDLMKRLSKQEIHEVFGDIKNMMHEECYREWYDDDPEMKAWVNRPDSEIR